MRSSGNLGSLKDEIYIPSSHAGGREETVFSLSTCISQVVGNTAFKSGQFYEMNKERWAHFAV